MTVTCCVNFCHDLFPTGQPLLLINSVAHSTAEYGRTVFFSENVRMMSNTSRDHRKRRGSLNLAPGVLYTDKRHGNPIPSMRG